MLKKILDYTLHFNKIGSLLVTTAKNWYNRDPFRESAIISYNAIFSLPGLLVVVFTLAGYFFDADVLSGRLHIQISQAMGHEAADQIQAIIVQGYKSKSTWWSTIIALVTIFIGATGVFVQMQKSLNNIWEVKATTTKSGIVSYIQTRLFSFGLIITIAFLLLISLVLSSFLSALSTWFMQHFSESFLVFFHILNFIVSLAIITILFVLMFKILPDAKIKWHLVWIGAFVTALLFVLGKTALGFYFGKANPGAGYGAAGAIILIMLWTSYSSMIVFFGAEFTKVYADVYYGEVKPSANAVKIETPVVTTPQ